jgi:hypothetical protein
MALPPSWQTPKENTRFQPLGSKRLANINPRDPVESKMPPSPRRHFAFRLNVFA